MGMKVSVLIYEKMRMLPGRNMVKGCKTINKRRLFQFSYKNKATSKCKRKIIREQKKSMANKSKEKEGTLYKARGFH